METACHHKNCRRRRHGDAGVHRRGIAAFGGGESRRLAAEKTPCPRRGENCRRLAAERAGVHRRGIAAFGGRESRRLAAEKTPCPRRRKLPPSGGGDKRGQDTKYGFLSPLDSPYLPLRCDSLRSRSEMRGAHSDVWCSKGTPLIEAERFAAERDRPAPSGRALVCAAKHASKIQGSSAAYKLKDARNRVPVTPRLDARPKGVAS